MENSITESKPELKPLRFAQDFCSNERGILHIFICAHDMHFNSHMAVLNGQESAPIARNHLLIAVTSHDHTVKISHCILIGIVR